MTAFALPARRRTRTRIERRRTSRRPGDLIRFSMLGSRAVYQVVATYSDYTLVRVILAPGLERGTLVRLTPGAFAMEDR